MLLCHILYLQELKDVVIGGFNSTVKGVIETLDGKLLNYTKCNVYLPESCRTKLYNTNIVFARYEMSTIFISALMHAIYTSSLLI